MFRNSADLSRFLWMLIFGGWFFCSPISLYSQVSQTERALRKQYFAFSDTTIRKIESFFDRHQKIGNFNGTYLMFKQDSLIYGSRGYAIYSNLDSVEPNDIFQLASVSKVFTGVAVMQLHQDGYL